MRTIPFSTAVFAGLLVLGACAPRGPEPIRPEPIFNKYGDVIGGCIPEGYQGTAGAASSGLPLCEDICVDGQNAAGTANDPNCYPRYRQDDDPNNSGRPGGGGQTGARQ